MDWFLYDNGLRHEMFKHVFIYVSSTSLSDEKILFNSLLIYTV